MNEGCLRDNPILRFILGIPLTTAVPASSTGSPSDSRAARRQSPGIVIGFATDHFTFTYRIMLEARGLSLLFRLHPYPKHLQTLNVMYLLD
jgi:hypothetical protein